jgi:putative GTP pyrophosphokinase
MKEPASKQLPVEDLPSRVQTKRLYDRYRPQYEMAQAKISRKIRKLLFQNQINAILRIRVKTFDSFFNKLLRFYNDGCRQDLMISDLIGIRIICSFIGDIEVIRQLLVNNFTVTEIEQKGAAHSFKEFGYDSLHFLIQLPKEMITNPIPYTQQSCEIQVRTKLQDAWAEVEHELIYKADYSLLNEYIKRKLAMLNASLTLSDMIFQEVREYQRLRQAKEEKRRTSILSTMEAVENANPFSGYPEPLTLSSEAAPVDLPNATVDRLLFQALDAHSKQDYDKALRLYSQILEKSTDNKVNSVIYNHRGMVYFVLGEYEKAVQDFTHAVQLNQNNFRAYNNRGLVYRMLKKHERAFEDFESSLEIEALQTDAYFGRSQLYFELCNYPKALEDCKKVLNINPDFTPAQRFLHIVQSKLFE